jgi:hypothetical protein
MAGAVVQRALRDVVESGPPLHYRLPRARAQVDFVQQI